MPSQTARLHQLSIDAADFDSPLFNPTAFYWLETINSGLSAQILVYSEQFIDNNICLSLINTNVCLSILTITRAPSHHNDLIKAITYQHSDGALHFYSLKIVTPDWQLTQSIHTRRFVGQSTLDIITTILSD